MSFNKKASAFAEAFLCVKDIFYKSINNVSVTLLLTVLTVVGSTSPCEKKVCCMSLLA